MENKDLESYQEYCVEYVLNRLEEFEGSHFNDSFELSQSITEHDNASGSFTYSTYNAQQYIKAWFDSVGEFLESYESEFGESLQANPFSESEKFHAIMVIVGIEKMLSNLKAIPSESFTLTKELIESIKQELSKGK
jgi:hypothetical protein